MFCRICKKDAYFYESHLRKAHKLSVEAYTKQFFKLKKGFGLCRCGCGRETGWDWSRHIFKSFYNRSCLGKVGMKTMLKRYPNIVRENNKNGISGLKLAFALHPNMCRDRNIKFHKSNPDWARNNIRKQFQNDPEMPIRAGKVGGKASIQLLFQHGKPNKLEKDFSYHTGLEWNKKSVKTKLGNKWPDFIKGNKIIELFGDYWHQGEDPKDRINLFKAVGYECLVIWESDWYNRKSYWVKVVKKFIG